MSEQSLQYLQSAYNKIGEAGLAWKGWANALVPEYDAARTDHAAALKEVSENVQAQIDQKWAALHFALMAVGAPWVGRLLERGKRVVEATGVKTAVTGLDELTAAFVKDSFDAMSSEAQEAIKGSALDALKNMAVGGTNDGYTPIADSTVSWGSRMEESIVYREKDLKLAANEQVRNAHKWSVSAAKSYEQAIVMRCPFVADQPERPSGDDRKKFRIKAELEMWIEWGFAISNEWWMEQLQDGGYESFAPIVRRLLTLGVPHFEMSMPVNSPRATYAYAFRIDLFRNWAAKLREREQRPRRVAEYAARSGFLQPPKQKPQVCYPGLSGQDIQKYGRFWPNLGH